MTIALITLGRSIEINYRSNILEYERVIFIKRAVGLCWKKTFFGEKTRSSETAIKISTIGERWYQKCSRNGLGPYFINVPRLTNWFSTFSFSSPPRSSIELTRASLFLGLVDRSIEREREKDCKLIDVSFSKRTAECEFLSISTDHRPKRSKFKSPRSESDFLSYPDKRSQIAFTY